MKQIALSFISVVALLMVSCNKNQDMTPKSTSLSFTIEQTETKTALYGANHIRWETGDQLSIPVGTGDEYKVFTLSSGANTQTGTFSISEDVTIKEDWAFYGATVNSPKWVTGGISINVPAEIAYTDQGIKAPMAAYLNEYKSFSLATGVLKVDVYGIPDEARKLVFNSNGKKVAGDLVFDTSTAQILSEDGASNNTITITFAAGQSNRSFFIPLPAATYTNFSIELQTAESAAISGTHKSGTLTIAKNKIVFAPAITLNTASYDLLATSQSYTAWTGISYENTALETVSGGAFTTWKSIPTGWRMNIQHSEPSETTKIYLKNESWKDMKVVTLSSTGSTTFTLTSDVLNVGTLNIQIDKNITLDKISLLAPAAEIVIWQGEFDFPDGYFDELQTPAYWANLAAGKVLTCYYTEMLVLPADPNWISFGLQCPYGTWPWYGDMGHGPCGYNFHDCQSYVINNTETITVKNDPLVETMTPLEILKTYGLRLHGNDIVLTKITLQ